MYSGPKVYYVYIMSNRSKLIVSMNPEWRDLSEGWYERHRYQPEKAG
jgi:hypothetical protein